MEKNRMKVTFEMNEKNNVTMNVSYSYNQEVEADDTAMFHLVCLDFVLSEIFKKQLDEKEIRGSVKTSIKRMEPNKRKEFLESLKFDNYEEMSEEEAIKAAAETFLIARRTTMLASRVTAEQIIKERYSGKELDEVTTRKIMINEGEIQKAVDAANL